MRERSAALVAEENVGSPLTVWNGQRHSTETFLKARELRVWIAQHPDCLSSEMPEGLRGYLSFLQRKRLATCHGRPARWFVLVAQTF